jgi:hypothetical protein
MGDPPDSKLNATRPMTMIEEPADKMWSLACLEIKRRFSVRKVE